MSMLSPSTLTILTTYRCTAACKQCCFESSPDVVGRLTLEQIIGRIDEARSAFKTLQLVVFSGGEATLLKSDLHRAIRHCTDLGLMSRVVSNGSWGKGERSASAMAKAFADAGLTELNISTGKDHQEFVPLSSVIQGACAATDAGIPTLITIEADDADNTRFREIASDARVKTRVQSRVLNLQSNSWMPFKSDADTRVQTVEKESLRGGCRQLFDNAVITPHHNLSACCGLTLEHIPEMRLGTCDGGNLSALYNDQADDFLKFWLRVDGPYSIIEDAMGDEAGSVLEGVVHICQACAILHKDERVKARVRAHAPEVARAVMTRFHLERALDARLVSP